MRANARARRSSDTTSTPPSATCRLPADASRCAICCALLLAAAIAQSGLPRAFAEGGSIVGWGGQVVGVDLSAGFVAVAAGSTHSLGLKADGSIVAWGRNDYGQTNVPAPNTGFIGVAAGGYYHSVGIRRVDPPLPWLWGDYHGNRVIDLEDHAALVERLDGPDLRPTVTGWHLLDLDHDFDVDLSDLAEFQNVFASSN